MGKYMDYGSHPLDLEVIERTQERDRQRRSGNYSNRQTSVGYFDGMYWSYRSQGMTPRDACELALLDTMERAEDEDIKHYSLIARQYWKMMDGKNYKEGETSAYIEVVQEDHGEKFRSNVSLDDTWTKDMRPARWWVKV